MNDKRLTVSLTATAISFCVNMVIGFFLTPYVVENIGAELNGFVSLADSFVNYAQIVTVALNSMAGRFIAVAYHQNKRDEARQYMSSVFLANVGMCVVMLLPALLCVLNLERLINISLEEVKDVKVLFLLVFASFFVALVYTAFASATFIANRKDLEAKRNVESKLIKAGTLVALFTLLRPHVYYVGIASVLMSVYVLITNVYYTKKLTPDMAISAKYFSREKVATLVKSGAWNSVGQLSNVLSEGLDLLITNLFVSPAAMGMLAIAKQMPGVIRSFIGAIGGVFAPSYTIAYAKDDKQGLMSSIRQSMQILGLVSNLCLVVLVSVGVPFFSLWVPSQDATQLQILSLLTVTGMAINGGIQCMFNIFTLTNRIRANTLVSFASNVLNLVVVYALLRSTDLGIYAIAGVSTVITIVRNIVFTIPYAARCIDVKPRLFFIPVLQNLTSLLLCSFVGYYIAKWMHIDSWVGLLFSASVICFVTVIINLAIVTDRNDRRRLRERMSQVLKSGSRE